MIWVFLSAIEHWTDIFTKVSKKTRDHCIFLPSGSGQLKAPHFICEAQTNSPNVHLFTGMSVEFHPLFCWPVTQSCKLFCILSLSINNFIPLTKSCLTTRFSHCLFSPPLTTYEYVEWQTPAQDSTSELSSLQELTIHFNFLYPVVLSCYLSPQRASLLSHGC